MSNTLRDRIAAVQRAHLLRKSVVYPAADLYCDCDIRMDSREAHADHVADAVIEALGLKREVEPYRIAEVAAHRYVTDWTTNE